jgi:hypothetical protein
MAYCLIGWTKQECGTSLTILWFITLLQKWLSAQSLPGTYRPLILTKQMPPLILKDRPPNSATSVQVPFSLGSTCINPQWFKSRETQQSRDVTPELISLVCLIFMISLVCFLRLNFVITLTKSTLLLWGVGGRSVQLAVPYSWLCFVCLFETGSHYVAWAGLELMVLLPLLPKC